MTALLLAVYCTMPQHKPQGQIFSLQNGKPEAQDLLSYLKLIKPENESLHFLVMLLCFLRCCIIGIYLEVFVSLQIIILISCEISVINMI